MPLVIRFMISKRQEKNSELICFGILKVNKTLVLSKLFAF